ncbi:MAG: NEW3 domain-containing protein [Planctomycetota bacterium]
MSGTSHFGWIRGASSCLCAIVSFLGNPTVADSNEATVTGETISLGTVYTFDFDELAEGNVEDVPMLWERLRIPGFPEYTRGSLDREIGHLAPPSFQLVGEGRHVAFAYVGEAIPVRQGKQYRVEGYIRPDRLERARACLTAHFVDKQGEMMAETLVRSSFLAKSDNGEDWVRVEIPLPPPPPSARFIHLGAWVLQESLWNVSARQPRAIGRVDVHGAAWFDDLSVLISPHVEFSTSHSGNVLSMDGPRALRVRVLDDGDPNLSGVVTITNSEDKVVANPPVDWELREGAMSSTINLESLPVGVYDAELRMPTEGPAMVRKKLVFVCVPPSVSLIKHASGAFGVVLDSTHPLSVPTQISLIKSTGVGAVKVPLSLSGTGGGRESVFRQLTSTLTDTGFDVTGLVDRATDEGSIQGVKGSDRTKASSEGLPRKIQVGNDRDSIFNQAGGDLESKSDEAGAPSSSDEMRGRVTAISAAVEPPNHPLIGDELTLAAGPEVGWEWLSSRIQQTKEKGHPRVSAYIEPLDSTSYRRIPRLADYAQRLVAARHAGANPVFVPAPWTSGGDSSESPEPQEELIVLRTLGDILGHAEPGPRLNLGSGIQGLAFFDGEYAIVALWAAMSDEEGESHALELGHASRQIDLWGRVRSLTVDDQGRRVVELSQVPVFVDGVERWLLEFRNSMTWEPPMVEAGLHPVRHQLQMTHRGTFALTGQVTLSTPADWGVKPTSFELRLAPGQSTSFPIEIQYPPSESAGKKFITANVSIMGGAHQVSIPLTFEIGLHDVEITGQASLDQGGLVIRHRVTNNTAHPTSFRSTVQIPGRERQYRRIDQLAPKETHSVEYRFIDVGPLAGQTARLMLRPGSDDLRSHTIELRIP